MEYNHDQQIIPMEPPRNPKKKSNLGKNVSMILACALVGGVSGVGGAALYGQANTVNPQINYTNPPLETQKIVTYSSKNVALPDLYTMNVGATVGITVSMQSVNYFGQPTSSAATGSGFVISSDGYVVTNYHVIEEATQSADVPIEVKFINGDVYSATVVGYEDDNDLAVLKIDATDLQAVVMGDSDELVVGETVVAIGNPLGELDFTFTDGIISAKDRLISTGDGMTMNMLQTNTAINPGNSGGPLFDGQGALIGINTAKYAQSSDGTTVEGLGFAIPINDVKDMITDIIQNGYVTGKPYLGITVTNVSSEAQAYGIVAGASVQGVAEGGAAYKAGLEINDIITAINDTAVDSLTALTAAMNEHKAGDTVEFTVVRNQEEMILKVTFDEKNEETEANNQYIQPEQTQQNQNGQQGGNSGNNNSYSGWPESWEGFPFDSFFP